MKLAGGLMRFSSCHTNLRFIHTCCVSELCDSESSCCKNRASSQQMLCTLEARLQESYVCRVATDGINTGISLSGSKAQ